MGKGKLGPEEFFYSKILRPLINTSKLGREALSGGAGKGLFVDYVYQNRASGYSKMGYFIDKVLLNLPSGKATREKKTRIIELIQAELDKRALVEGTMKIVDLGSGSARYLVELSLGENKGRVQSLCLDVDKESIKQGRSTAQDSPIEYRLGNIKRLDHYKKLAKRLKWEPDVIIVSTCFDFFEDGFVRSTMEDLYGILKSQGLLIIVNQVKNPNKKLFDHLVTTKDGKKWSVNCREPFVVKKWLTEAGFRDISSTVDQWGMYGYYTARKFGISDHLDSQRPIFRKSIDYKRAIEQRADDVYQYMRGFTPLIDGKAMHGGHKVIMMASNNYLGLAMHEEVISATNEAVRKYGASTASSRILTGNLDIHEELQEKLAEFFNVEDALIFSTGYMCNLGVMASLLEAGDIAFIDRDAHASILDGAELSKGDVRFFPHNDMKQLDNLLLKHEDVKGKLIVCDGVYSMDGDLADLPSICSLADKHKAGVVVDDGHVTGIFGEHGRGTAEHFKLEGKVDLIIGSLGKALASVGGFVVGKHTIIDFLRHTSRPLIFSTSLSPANAAAAIAALKVLRREPSLRERLWTNTGRMRDGLIALGFNVGKTQSPLIPVIIGDESVTYRMVMVLEELGVIVDGVSFPAVKRNMSRIRIRIIATHTSEDIDTALACFKKAGEKFGVI